jgi:glycosyltransferase involved in cell wall biosynthesis
MKATAEVSIVIPTRDRWARLRTTLSGAIGQREVEHEVIVVDDGSGDWTRDRLAELAHPRIRVVRNERSTGVAGARNRGLAESAGDWIAFLDDDDLWSPRKLRSQLDVAVRTGAEFAYSDVLYLDERGSIIQFEGAPDPADLQVLLFERNAIPATGSNLIAKASALRQLGGLDEQLLHLADWDLGLRLATRFLGAACNEPLVGYVRHPENMVLESDHDPFQELEYMIRKHGQESLGDSVDLVAFTGWMARAHLREARRIPAARIRLRGGAKYRDLGSVLRGLDALLDPWATKRSRRPAPIEANAEASWLDAYRHAFSTGERRRSRFSLTGLLGGGSRSVGRRESS